MPHKKCRRGRRHNAHYVAPPVVLRPLSVPIFRFIPPEPKDEYTETTVDTDTDYRADGESVGTRRMASGAGKNLQFRGQREGVDDLIATNERRLMILQGQLFAKPPMSSARAQIRKECSTVKEMLERLRQIRDRP